MILKNNIFKLLTGPLSQLIGPKNLVRTGAFIMRAGRLDIPNSIGGNGEALVQKTVLKHLSGKTGVIIDCGANMGQWSTELASTAKSFDEELLLRIFCFEPSSYTFKKLSTTLNKLQLKNVKYLPIQKALSSQAGTFDLKIVHDGAGTNSLVGVPDNYETEETVSVTTIGGFAKQHDLSHIDFLKIDAEGHDFDVILGAEKLLDDLQISVIQFEYNWRWIYGKHFLQEVFQFLGDRNYSIGKITPQGIQFYPHYDVLMESFVEGNYLACTSTWKNYFPKVPGWFE